MQFRVVLASQNGKDCLVSAGTGSGKTLPIALNALLDDPLKNPATLVLLPLKRLQVTQETDFNSRYGIPVVVINEDTPREDA
jgi:replicative superfamily II helicase